MNYQFSAVLFDKLVKNVPSFLVFLFVVEISQSAMKYGQLSMKQKVKYYFRRCRVAIHTFFCAGVIYKIFEYVCY